MTLVVIVSKSRYMSGRFVVTANALFKSTVVVGVGSLYQKRAPIEQALESSGLECQHSKHLSLFLVK
jgi:hypothetical protein